MNAKARYLTVGILLITLSLATLQAPLHAQDTGNPEATEDSCPAIIDAAIATRDATMPVATADPALDSCLETLSTTVVDATSPTGVTAREAAQPTATEPATPDSVYIPITLIHSNLLTDAGRVWVTWHDPTTGALTVTLGSYGLRLSYYNMGLDVTIPNNSVDIGIRVETSPDRSSDTWQHNPTCTFTFTEPPQGFSVTIDDNNVCSGVMASAATSAPQLQRRNFRGRR